MLKKESHKPNLLSRHPSCFILDTQPNLGKYYSTICRPMRFFDGPQGKFAPEY